MIKRIWKEHKALRIIAVIILIIVIIVSGLFISVNMILSRANKARNTFAIAGQEYIEKKKMTNILLLGCDKREDLINHSGIAGQNGQTDFICLASIDWENETVYLTSIPRETVTDIHVRDNDGNVTQVESKQLCLEYAYGRSPDEGSQYMVDAVSQILGGTSIDYYCTISMGAIIGLLDDVGGVTVNVSNDCETTLWEYKAGDVVDMTGDEAYEFIHFRSIYTDYSNLDRMGRQKDFMAAFVPKLKSAIKSNYKLPWKWANKYNTYYVSNIPEYMYPFIAYAVLKYNYGFDSMTQISGIEEHRDNHDWFYVDSDGVDAMLSVTLYDRRK